MRWRGYPGKEDGDGRGPSLSLKGWKLNPEHHREGVRASLLPPVEEVAAADLGQRRVVRSSLPLAMAFLLDHSGRGFPSHGKDVGQAGLTPK